MASANDGTIEAVKTLIWDNLIDAALIALYAEFPWLAWGLFKWLTGYIARKYSDIFYEFVSEFINLKQIALTNKKDNDKFTESSVRLYLLARDYGVNSKEYLEYKNEAKEDFKNIIKFGVAKSS